MPESVLNTEITKVAETIFTIKKDQSSGFSRPTDECTG